MAFPGDLPHAMWKQAIEHYYWDRLAEAYEVASTQGAGHAGIYLSWFRMIEAEWLTRRDGQRTPVTDWLDLEFVPDDLGPVPVQDLAEVVVASCDEVAQRLGLPHGAKTLVTMLREEARAPWAIAPYGYCVDMHPYEKVCMPVHLLGNGPELRRTTRHEYAHVLTINASGGHAPRWLSEAVSVLMEGGRDRSTEREFYYGSAEWLPIDRLEQAFNAPDDRRRVWLAYRQAGLVGEYLALQYGESRLGDLLRAHAEGSFWKRLGAGFLGATHTDVAFRDVVGRSPGQVVADALEWLRSGRR